MFSRVLFLIGVLAAALLVANCSDDSTNPPAMTDPLAELKAQLAQTPRLNREAEEMALWLSKELVASEWLYLRCDSALHHLRNQYYGRPPQALQASYFQMTPPPSCVFIIFDSATSAAVNEGRYSDWDSLNTLFRGFIDYLWEGDETFPTTAQLRFEGRVNSDSLASYYDLLPGVAEATPLAQFLSASQEKRIVAEEAFYERSSLLPYEQEEQFRFLLHTGWGDCQSFCIYNFFSYFREEADSFHWVGDTYFTDTTDFPNWWYAEAAEILCWHWFGQDCDTSWIEPH